MTSANTSSYALSAGPGLAGFMSSLDTLTGWVEDSTRHGEVIAMGEQLRRVQYAYKCLREKAEVADPKILTALGRVLAHFLERIDDESLCRDACSFVPSLARGCAYRGADWAVSLMPYLLTCLEQEHSTINTTAYQSLVAMVSHCYDAKGRLLASILNAMDRNIGRQLHQLVKIVIEKWPPSSVQAHMPALCERLVIDIRSSNKAQRDWATQSFLALNRKWPTQGSQVFQALPGKIQIRLARDHPHLEMLRQKPRYSPSYKSPSNSKKRLQNCPPLSKQKDMSSGGSVAVERKEAGPDGSRIWEDDPRGASGRSPSTSQQELHQKLLKFKLKNDVRFKDAALYAALSHPIAWDLSSDDGSTASSIQSDGNGPSHAFRYSDNATRRAQQVLQHKLNMMSPTDKHMLAEAKANPGPIKNVATYADSPMQKFQNPDSPMQKFQQDLNLSVAAMFEAEVQPFSALEELPTSQAHVTWQENKETSSVLCKATHIEAGQDEERSPQQGHKDRCNSLFRTTRSSHLEKHVSFSAENVVINTSASPSLPLHSSHLEQAAAESRTFDEARMRTSDDQGLDKGIEGEEIEMEESFDYNDVEEQDFSSSKKNLKGDIAEECAGIVIEDRDLFEYANRRKPSNEEKLKLVKGKVQAACVFLFICMTMICFLTLVLGLVKNVYKHTGSSVQARHKKPSITQVSFVPCSSGTHLPANTSPTNRETGTEKETPAIQTRAAPLTILDPIACAQQEITQVTRQQVKQHRGSVLFNEELRDHLAPRNGLQPVQKKCVRSFIYDALQRLFNFRIVGVLLGYSLIYVLLV